MNDELYNLWIQRTDDEAPADFADRVMDAVRREPPPAQDVLVPRLRSPAVRVTACVLAGLACMYRMAAVVAVFFPQ